MSIENREKSIKVRTGKRTYFIDVEKNKIDKRKFIMLTESKNIGADGFERQEIKIYKEDLPKIIEALITIKNYLYEEALITPNYMQQQKEKWVNAYTPWTDEQNSQLADLYYGGESLANICEKMQRNIGAIRSQIRKLNL